MIGDATAQKNSNRSLFNPDGRFEHTALDSPRLKKIRTDILQSKYHLCTQKASLMTEYFLSRGTPDPLFSAVSNIHYTLFKKSLAKTAQGIPQKKWQIAFNEYLNRFYLNRSGLSRSGQMIAQAEALAYILDNMSLTVYEHELIVGNPSSHRVGAPIHPDLGGMMMLPEIDRLDTRPQNPMSIDPEQLEELKETIFPYWFYRSVLAMMPLYSKNRELPAQLLEGSSFILTQFAGISHVTPDYEKVLRVGFKGIKAELLKKLVEVNYEIADRLKRPDTGGQTEAIGDLRTRSAFYKAALKTVDAGIRYGFRWRGRLEKLAGIEKDEKRRSELLFLADMFSRIPGEPASTFYEAVQSLFIAHVMVHQESFQHGVSFGRLDQYLYPYFKQDLNSGKLSVKKAVEILGCFLGKSGELLPLFFDRATEYFSGLSSASGITLGGLKQDNRDGVNELSYLILQAYDQVRLRQPNIHVRINEDSPDDFLELSTRVLRKGGGLPAFFNDRRIIPTLENFGIRKNDAIEYSIVGCVEWGVPGKSFPAAGAVFINLALALYLALHNGLLNGKRFGPATGEIEDLKTMDDLLQAFKLQLRNIISIAVEGNNAIERAHACHRPTPLLSAIVDGCIASGEEVNNGGAVYNSTGCQGVGFADVVDSLIAVDDVVFREKRMTLKEFADKIDDDFKTDPQLLNHIINKLPKFGLNKKRAGYFAEVISGLFADEVFRMTNPRGGKYAAGFWSMTTHQGFGARTPTLPSGRLKGVPLSNGASPANGRDRHGPTAALADASFLKSDLIANGYALNMKLNTINMPDPKSEKLLKWLIKGYFNNGGMQVQFNIVDPETLLNARDHPEKYPDLVVRVSGYSAYFNDLTDSMKNELIARSIHNICDDSCC